MTTRHHSRCLDYFNHVRADFVRNEQDLEPFIAGLVTGLCEKVHLGACRAAMLAPRTHQMLVLRVIERIAPLYHLLIRQYDSPNAREFWIFRDPSAVQAFENARTLSRHIFNRCRAELCGIPADEVIDNYPFDLD